MAIRSLDVGFCDAVHCLAHGPVVMTSRDDQVDLEQSAIFISSVIMDEGAARCLDDTHAVSLVILAGVQKICAEDIGVFAQGADSLDAEHHFDQASIVV